MNITRRASRRATLATASIGALALLFGTAGSAQAATAPGLGTADSFAILAGEGVTNIGPTTVTGDLGTAPNPAITGAGPGADSITLNGATHPADDVAILAKTDLVTAYDNAAGQGPTIPITTDLAGLRLVPGVYNSGSTIGLSGELTLDALGDPNAVWVFQAASGLTVGEGASVTVVNGAQACNVFWQVGSTATLGTGARFIGTIMAMASITLANSATVHGRVLARTGSVTMNTNTITRPVCAAPASEVAPNAVRAPVGAAQVGVAPTGGVSTGDGSTSGSDTTPYLLGGGVAVVALTVVAFGAMTAAAVRVRKRNR